jgi:hypothetical protein
VTRVAANAASPERRKTYSLVAACSRGYDSTAAAALASLAGCREGVTFVESRHPLGHPLTGLRYEAHDDCGTPVLTALGIEAREFDRNGIHAIPGYPRAEFFLSPVGVTDMSTVVMEPWLRGRVLVSGRHGERYWSLRMSSRRQNLAETDDVHLSGGALAEFRLRAGFLHFPVPYVGALHGCALHGITHSEEMRPWRLGTRYDRPIARRIAEQAGVPRHMFGQLKMGAGQMSRSLDGESYRDFLAYVEAHVPERLRRRLDYRLLDDRVENHYKLRYLRTNYSYPPAAGRLLTFVGSERLHMLWNSVYLYQFHWGAAKIAGRYDIFSSHGG